MNGLERMYAVGYNVCNQQWQEDGSCIMTFYKNGDLQATHIHVHDLHGPNEKLLKDETVDISPYMHIIERQLSSAFALSAETEAAGEP